MYSYLISQFHRVDDYDDYLKLGEALFNATRSCDLLHVIYHIGIENLADIIFNRTIIVGQDDDENDPDIPDYIPLVNMNGLELDYTDIEQLF